jgi:hypothetical protein
MMGTKLNPGKFDCYANALPDEPMFVLLARDPFAPELVRLWARTAELGNRAARPDNVGRAISTVPDKIAEAMECAEAMRRWREANPKPDGGYPMPAERGEIPIAYLRDAGDDNDPCYVPADKGDPGAFPVYR